jgi:DNA-binding MarR family transcriptional regulator
MRAPAEVLDLDVLRLRGEFLEMPGLIINNSQVARLLDVLVPHASELLDALEKEDFLIRVPSGSYRRAHPLYA